jgi:coenzyme F420-0:L-glutamate ligase / coenzyme F420-1:gamma-L-glutamate ligase
MGSSSLAFYALPGIPKVHAGDDVTRLLVAALRRAELPIATGDIVAVTQKIVSKAEGRLRRLDEVQPGERARALARETNKDPRVIELLLQESREILRAQREVIIAEHRTGLILANAGIDRSNLGAGDDVVLLLPKDPDASAARIRGGLQAEFGFAPGVIITDSVGRPWRLGTVGLAIGSAGVPVVRDLRGVVDLYGRALQVSETAPADSLAAAAVLLMGEASEGTPAVLIRGYPEPSAQMAGDVLRPKDLDLFR